MINKMINDFCCTSDDVNDLFVGIKYIDGQPKVIFPHGYNIANDDSEKRKDIFRLLSCISKFADKNEYESTNEKKDIISRLPLSSYQYIINDYLLNGYYYEKETVYADSVKGKINWKKTIQQKKPHLDANNIIYLEFKTRKNKIKIDNLVTQIHKYCVYISFYKFGWLYLPYDYLPIKPGIKYDKKLFISTITSELNKTYDDKKRMLFNSMINIINDSKESLNDVNVSIGTDHFETVWEKLITYTFGNENKNKYFPHANWHIVSNDKAEISSALIPDTIMCYKDKYYVLDAKYYKYGITNNVKDLPKTDSIQKQITYAKHIVENNDIEINSVYNAFVMPFNSGRDNSIKFIGVGTADWEKYNNNTPNYAYVLGILLDTKKLVNEYCFLNNKEIENLSTQIEKSLKTYLSNQHDKKTNKTQNDTM